MNLEEARKIIKTAKEAEEAKTFLKRKVDIYLEAISKINSICENIFLAYLFDKTEYNSFTIEFSHNKILCDDLCPQLDSYVQLHLANLGLNHFTTFNEISVQKISENEQKLLIKIVVKFNKI